MYLRWPKIAGSCLLELLFSYKHSESRVSNKIKNYLKVFKKQRKINLNFQMKFCWL